MVYSDIDIKRLLEYGKSKKSCGEWIIVTGEMFSPEKQIQPASIDLRLGNEFAEFKYNRELSIKDRNVDMQISKFDTFRLSSGSFVLGTTIERVELGDQIVGRIEGKSSLGRIGLAAHVTAGFIDPGFCGQITLELYNVSPHTIVLVPGCFICQLALMKCTSKSINPYGSDGLESLYQNQLGVTPIRKKEMV